MNVLFASSEVWPLIKTGGLGDVSYSLPHALHQQGLDVRIVLPAYQDVLKQLTSFTILGWLNLPIGGDVKSVRILEVNHDQFSMPIWLVDCPSLFDRAGTPYVHEQGYDWPDNAERFTLFSQAVAKLSVDTLQLGWKADVVHSNDWQTGLVSTFLENEANPPRRIFTIHNMAYGGHFSQDVFKQLGLSYVWWSEEGVEFYGNLCMLKAGIIYSDAVTTVSPTYAQEICTPAFAYGMEGVLTSRMYKLSGILNGIDNDVWNPATDPLIPYHYSAKKRNPNKQKNKQALLESYGIKTTKQNLVAPLVGMVSRLVEQKGVDMVIEALPTLLETTDANFVFIGTGSPTFENQLTQLSKQHPNRVMTTIGYFEDKAHLLEAGCDIFIMPSRFEPCGLNQLYSLRYGTIPVVNHTGGLADTVIDARLNDKNKLNPNATGFVMETPTTSSFIHTLQRALSLFTQKKHWNQLQRTAMKKDFGWEISALKYIKLYRNKA